MDTSESSTSVRGKGKNKRKWTAIEDDELINMLYEVCLDPKWRSDSSFKNGYMSAIEAHLAKKLPEARITAVPHIESRLRYFKSKFSSLEQMLVLSGFTWDENKKMCKKQQYDNQCKSHPDAKGLYGIPFPYYDTLSAIYSKDLTTGEGAEDMSDAVNNLEQELAAGIGNGQEEEERASRETPRRSFDSTSSTSKKHKKDRKPKESVSNDPLLDMFSEVSQDLKRVTKSVDKMAQAMAREAAAQEKIIIEDPDQKLRENAVSELRKLEITGSELIQAASVFARMPDQMVMMFALPELLRREYVVNMLHDETQRKERGKQGGSS